MKAYQSRSGLFPRMGIAQYSKEQERLYPDHTPLAGTKLETRHLLDVCRHAGDLHIEDKIGLICLLEYTVGRTLRVILSCNTIPLFETFQQNLLNLMGQCEDKQLSPIYSHFEHISRPEQEITGPKRSHFGQAELILCENSALTSWLSSQLFPLPSEIPYRERQSCLEEEKEKELFESLRKASLFDLAYIWKVLSQQLDGIGRTEDDLNLREGEQWNAYNQTGLISLSLKLERVFILRNQLSTSPFFMSQVETARASVKKQLYTQQGRLFYVLLQERIDGLELNLQRFGMKTLEKIREQGMQEVESFFDCTNPCVEEDPPYYHFSHLSSES